MINLKEIIEEEKVIIAIKRMEDLPTALKSKGKIVFLLFGNILNVEEITRTLKGAGKLVFVHMDMISGFDSKEPLIIDFLKENSYADGIISTKPTMIKYAKKHKMLAIQRCFLLDSLSLENSMKMLKEAGPDAIEILPGVMPKIIKKLACNIKIPLIAGGMISDFEDIEIALEAGANAVSTTKKELWSI